MNKFLFILLFPILMFGQGVDPNKQLITFEYMQYLVDYGNFYPKTTITSTKEGVTVLEAKNSLYIKTDVSSPIYGMPDNRVVPRYALVPDEVAPTLSFVSATTNSLTFNWAGGLPGASAGNLSFAIQCCGEENIWVSNTASPIGPRTQNNLLPNQLYAFKVQLIYPGDVYGKWSNVVYATTLTDETVITTYVMRNIYNHEYINESSLNLKFQSPELLNATPSYYQLEYKLNSSGTWLVYGTTYPYVLNGTTYNVTGLTPSSHYDFRIRFYTTAGQWSNYSDTYSVQMSAFTDFQTVSVYWESATVGFSGIPPITVNGVIRKVDRYYVRYRGVWSASGTAQPDFSNSSYVESTMDVIRDNPPTYISVQINRPDDNLNNCTTPKFLWYEISVRAQYDDSNPAPPAPQYDPIYSDWSTPEIFVLPKTLNPIITSYSPSYTFGYYCGLPIAFTVNAFSWWEEFTVSNFDFKFSGISYQSSSSPTYNGSTSNSLNGSVTATLVGGGNQTKSYTVTLLNGDFNPEFGAPPIWTKTF